MDIDLTIEGASPKLQEELREACENAKRELETANEAEIKLENVKDGQSWATTFTLAQFNGAIKGFEEEYIACIETALNDAFFDMDEISEVVMVGRSTRDPIIRQKVKDYFEKDGHQVIMLDGLDPSTIAAYGATMFAGKLSGQGAMADDQGINEIQLLDVTPLTIGILQSAKIEKDFLKSIFSRD